MIKVLYINRPFFPAGSAKAYLAAVGIVVAATLGQLALKPLIAGHPFFLYFPAVIFTTFVCGSAPAVFAWALSLVMVWLVFFPLTLSDALAVRVFLYGIGCATAIGIVSLMRAATAHVWRLNDILQVSETKFRNLLESAPDGMIIIDEDRRIALVNAQTESLFGYDRSELLGMPVDSLIVERDRETYCAHLGLISGGCGTGPSNSGIELHARNKNGREFPIEANFGLLNNERGNLVCNTVRDISARREIEANLAAASRAKSDFLARMSHELRTPLNAIIGFSELIRDAIMGPVDARYRGYGGDINAAGRHLLNIINDILDISKVEGGRLELHEEIVSVPDAVEACRRMIVSLAESADVSLMISVPKTLPFVRADEIRLRQILLNVMSNAVKFTPAEGRVSVTAAVELDELVIAICDTGIGMRAQDIGVALEPFRQIDNSLSRRFAGTGLGLPLAKALIELHDGRLEIDSAVGCGTTVRLRLPAERLVETSTRARA